MYIEQRIANIESSIVHTMGCVSNIEQQLHTINEVPQHDMAIHVCPTIEIIPMNKPDTAMQLQRQINDLRYSIETQIEIMTEALCVKNKPLPLYNKHQVKNMTLEEIENADVSLLEDFSYMFANEDRFESINLSKWDMRNAINLECMFIESKFKHIDVSNWCFESRSSIYNSIFLYCSSMFANCKRVQTINVSDWSFKNCYAPKIDNMFNGCTTLHKIIGLENMLSTCKGSIAGYMCNGMFSKTMMTTYDLRNWSMLSIGTCAEWSLVSLGLLDQDADVYLPSTSVSQKTNPNNKCRLRIHYKE